MIGKEIGNYRILKELGKGGMGVVYKAHQLSLGRAVAMKVLPRHLTNDPAFIKRFHNEARAIARLNHPNIVQIFDIGQENDIHYYTMEFIEGPTLDDVIYKEGFLSPERTLAIIGQVSKALRYAHSQGIIHRDIKPSNIMIAKLGRVKITDFGLALQQRTTRLTVEGGIVGTPEYMSPEQAAGKTATAQSDIYSLGVVAYELLTGKVPFEGDSPLIVLNKIQNTEPQWPRSIDPNIPVDLENIVRKMMARNPSDRYASCQEIILDTQNIKSGAPVSLQLDRSPRFRLVGAGIAVAIIVALGVAFAMRRSVPPNGGIKNESGTVATSSDESIAVPRSEIPRKRPKKSNPVQTAAIVSGKKEVAFVSSGPQPGVIAEESSTVQHPDIPLRLDTPKEILQTALMLEDDFKELNLQLGWQEKELVRADFEADRQKLRLVENRLEDFENTMYPDLLVIRQGAGTSEIRGRIVGESLYRVEIDTTDVDRQRIARDKIELTKYANPTEKRRADELWQIKEKVAEIRKGEMSSIDNVLNPRGREKPTESVEEPTEDASEETGEVTTEESDDAVADRDEQTRDAETNPSKDETVEELSTEQNSDLEADSP